MREKIKLTPGTGVFLDKHSDRYVATCNCGSMVELTPTLHQKMLGTGGYAGKCNSCRAEYTVNTMTDERQAEALEKYL